MQKYKSVSFNNISQAIAEPNGWGAIANKPDWGYFKFGHTHPSKSNSGTMTLVCMAYDFKNNTKLLSNADVVNADFKAWMDGIERAVNNPAEGTDYLMRDMIGKGPSAYDCVFVYECVAIDYVKRAAGRWGKLRVDYPKYNVWNDNPYYILNVPWSKPEQREAAEALRKFLLSDDIQKMALDHGFRPGNLNVPVNGPDSPFKLYETNGLKADLGTFPPVPAWETVANLLHGWELGPGTH
jgi:ABC-type Fe3+ transport system substrate-binding protein